MSFDDITLAAECISIARIEFVEQVVIEPIIAVLGGEMKEGAKTHRSGKKKKPPQTEAEVDQSIAALQALFSR